MEKPSAPQENPSQKKQKKQQKKNTLQNEELQDKDCSFFNVFLSWLVNQNGKTPFTIYIIFSCKQNLTN